MLEARNLLKRIVGLESLSDRHIRRGKYAHGGLRIASRFDSFAGAVSSLRGADGDIYVDPKTYAIDANFTVPSNAYLVFAKGSLLVIANGVTLTINRQPEAGLYQIFSLTGTGKVSFPNPCTVQTEWWGAGTSAFGDAIMSLPKGGTIEITDDITQGSAITVDTTGFTEKWTSLYLRGNRPYTTITSTLAAGDLFKISGKSWAPERNIRLHIENLRFTGPVSPSGGGLYLDGTTGLIELSMENVFIETFADGIGLYAKEIYRGGGRDIEIRWCGTGLRLQDNANSNHWYNLKVRENLGFGAQIINCGSVGWFGGLIESNKQHGLYLQGCRGAVFEQVHFENNNANHVANRYAMFLDALDVPSRNNRITFDACVWGDPDKIHSQIFMQGTATNYNENITFIDCFHGGIDGPQLVLNGAFNRDIVFLNSDGFDTITNASNCKVYEIPPESWQTPTLLNSWVNYPGLSAAQYFKDGLGVVHLKGVVKDGTIGLPIFRLPVGYRSAEIEYHAVVSNNLFGVCQIVDDGNVYPTVGSNLWFGLDGITFREA